MNVVVVDDEAQAKTEKIFFVQRLTPTAAEHTTSSRQFQAALGNGVLKVCVGSCDEDINLDK